MANTYSAGIVTAYGAAKRGGYTGTYEEFCADLAKLADVLSEFLGFSVTVETLAAGTPATGSYDAGVLSLGIPQGETGNGIQSIILNADYTLTVTYTNGQTWTSGSIRGETGATPRLTIGTVQTLEPGQGATAEITGTPENPVLNLGIPQGQAGSSDAGAVTYNPETAYNDGTVGKAVSDLSRQISDDKGLIFSGTAEAGTTLFTSEEVTPGEILYVSLTPTTTSASYVELFDENDNRLGLFGKVSSYYGTRTNIGIIVIPEGFSVAKLNGYGATVNYIQKNFPAEFEKEVYDSLYGVHRNLLDGVSYQKKKILRIQTGEVEDYNVGFLSGQIPVIPKSKITVDFVIGSSCYGCGFYDANLNFVNGVVSSDNNHEFYVPDGAFFAQFSVTQAIINAGPHAWVTPPSEAEAEKALDAVNPYKRYAVHQYGTRFNGYMHIAFPRMCFFGGRTVVGYRAGYQHMPRTDNTYPGIWQFDAREADGTWVHVKSFSASDFTGVTGDARDLYIQPTRNGEYILLVGGFSHYVSGEVFYDCVVAVLDSELNIVDYKTFLNNDYYFYGNPLITPDGHIIFTYFAKSLRDSGIYRSEEVFNGTVSTLTFTRMPLDTTGSNHSECCLGYFNDKLVFIQRYESTLAAKMMVTSDLEGLTGWSTQSSLKISIQSPMLLPYYTGKYLPCVGSRNLSSEIQDRRPYLYYLDVANSTPVAYGDIDPNLLTSYNGYPTFLPLGGEKYAVAYYQECAVGTDVDYTRACAGIYYKWINAREICPQMAYLDV